LIEAGDFTDDIKSKITEDWDNFKLTLEDENLWTHSQWANAKRKEQQKRRIVRYGDYVVNYMNAEDYSSELAETAEYINFMDKQNATNFAEVYPELASIL
jgi:2-phosphoglycerate kinase